MSRILRRHASALVPVPALVIATLGLLGLALPALADPPARVGRLSDISGTVSFHDNGDQQWSPAALMPGTDRIDYQITEAQPTAFDNASLARERREEAASRPATRYVSPEMTGYEDLDDHGAWQSDPTYGTVWYPQAVPVDWAPYR